MWWWVGGEGGVANRVTVNPLVLTQSYFIPIIPTVSTIKDSAVNPFVCIQGIEGILQ